MSKFSFFAAALCFLLVAGGCGETSETGPMESPISNYLRYDDANFGPESDIQDEINRQIASCMQAEGFEWIPPDEGQSEAFVVTTDGLENGSEEYVAKYGFGFSTRRFSQEYVGPYLVGTTQNDVATDLAFTDPNDDYVNALTDAQRNAYNEALWGTDDGPEISEDMTDEEIEEVWETGRATRVGSGCGPKVREAHGADIVAAFELEFPDVSKRLLEGLAADPRIVAANQELADCVTDKGLQFTNMTDFYEDLHKRMEPILESADSTFDELIERSLKSMTAAQRDARLDSSFDDPELDDAFKKLLGEIQADEIALATAVSECGGRGYFNGIGVGDSLYYRVLTDTEHRFLKENQSWIDAFKAEYEVKNGRS